MSLANPPIDPTLDPITGLPTDASYFRQYQLPLASQPINLDELNVQGKQASWLYPDNLPPVVARLQARDLTNDGNAQDLSTNGKRSLNVNVVQDSSASGSDAIIVNGSQELSYGGGSPNQAINLNAYTSFKLFGFSFSWYLTPGSAFDGFINPFVGKITPGYVPVFNLFTDVAAQSANAAGNRYGGTITKSYSHPQELVKMFSSSGLPLFFQLDFVNGLSGVWNFIFEYTIQYTQ